MFSEKSHVQLELTHAAKFAFVKPPSSVSGLILHRTEPNIDHQMLTASVLNYAAVEILSLKLNETIFFWKTCNHSVCLRFRYRHQ